MFIKHEMAPIPIGTQIRSIRKKMGLSLQELARKAGTSAPTMHRYEGSWDGYTFSTLRKIAEALDADLEIRFLPHSHVEGYWLTSRKRPSCRHLLEKVQNLFWDKRLTEEDLGTHPLWVLKRILMEGSLDQIKMAVAYYGLERIAEVMKGKGIDAKTRSFWELVLRRGV